MLNTLAFWRSGKQHDREVHGGRKPSVLRKWQIKQWLAPKLVEGKQWIPPSLETRQRQRQAFRVLSFKNVNENYGPEPRPNRRRIGLKLAAKAHRTHRGRSAEPTCGPRGQRKAA